jgi:hypothetical protein
MLDEKESAHDCERSDREQPDPYGGSGGTRYIGHACTFLRAVKLGRRRANVSIPEAGAKRKRPAELLLGRPP